MEFSFNQFLKFGTKKGAYSKVTEREYYDSQITATDAECQLLIEYFGLENIAIGNVKTNKELSSKEFLLYPTGEKVNLNLVFPKPEKPELRLYLSRGAGFKPPGNSIWFLYIINGKIWIGSMSESQWRSENMGMIEDETDLIYQSIIQEQNNIRIASLSGKEIYTRDRNIAIKRMEIAKYQCENNPLHRLFISKYTGNPYLESHHLVPMSLQKDLNRNLDILENIFCLCPYCHRAIHNAVPRTALPLLDKLLNKRPEILGKIGVDEHDIYRFYSLEEIV